LVAIRWQLLDAQFFGLGSLLWCVCFEKYSEENNFCSVVAERMGFLPTNKKWTCQLKIKKWDALDVHDPLAFPFATLHFLF
jgi:hypothetical protein